MNYTSKLNKQNNVVNVNIVFYILQLYIDQLNGFFRGSIT